VRPSRYEEEYEAYYEKPQRHHQGERPRHYDAGYHADRRFEPKGENVQTFKNVAISAKTEEPTATKDKGIPNATTKTEEDTTANAATIGGPEATTETTSKIMATTSQDSLQ